MDPQTLREFLAEFERVADNAKFQLALKTGAGVAERREYWKTVGQIRGIDAALTIANGVASNLIGGDEEDGDVAGS